jgi:hypothetical protein
MAGSSAACPRSTLKTRIAHMEMPLPRLLFSRILRRSGMWSSILPTKSESSMEGDRERHGLFRAGAPQAARIRRPSIEYSGVVSPRPEQLIS